MDPDLFDNITAEADALNHWATPPVLLELHLSLDATASVTIDLVGTLNHRGRLKCNKFHFIQRHCYWFPPSFSTNCSQGRQQIIQFCAQACVPAGFSLVSGKMTQKPLKSGVTPLRLVCSRSRIYEKNKTSQNHRRSDTDRPKCWAEKCPFGFTVYYDNHVHRWLLPHEQGGCSHHAHHPRLDPSFLPVRKATINPKEMELIYQQLHLNINPSLVAKLFLERTGKNLTPAQVRKFR